MIDECMINSYRVMTLKSTVDEILSKNNGVWKFSEQNFLTMSDLEKIELEYEEKKDVID